MKQQEPYSPRILVVDDEQAILDEFREILCPNRVLDEVNRKFQDLYAKLFPTTCPAPLAASFDLVLCRQAEEAVEEVRAAVKQDKPFAVVFVDVRMPPGPDGVWAAEQIRALDPHAQLVVVTAYSDIDPSDISRRVRPADKLLYLQKPFHPHEIRQLAVALGSKWVAERQLHEHTIELTKSNEQLRREIAEHEQTEQERQLLSRAIMSTEDCVYITDMDGRIIFVNQAFCGTYRYTEEEILGKEDSILWARSSHAGGATSAYQVIGGWEVAFFHRRKTGEEFPVSLSKSEVRDETGEQVALVVIARDISERMQVENALRSEIRRLKQNNRRKKQTAAEVLDQLLDPLAVLKDVVCDAGSGAFGQISPQLKESLESAGNNIDQVMQAAGSLHEIAAPENEEIELMAD
ncbi:MAG TPA: PAS domain S-box protein [Sedimentisphaerales bacterium]|nr:PAS domain S-box protein [Sedimentisphaerales bacterium]